jgi:hypothetical protein
VLRKVNELIDPVTNTWDEDLIRSIFLQIDAERILRIPLSRTYQMTLLPGTKQRIIFFRFGRRIILSGMISLVTLSEGEMVKVRPK